MRSDAVKKGMATAPQRSLFNALGITKEELEKPLVGIVSSYNDSLLQTKRLCFCNCHFYHCLVDILQKYPKLYN